MLSRRTHPERASAIVGALALMVIAGFVIVAIMVAAKSSSDSTRSGVEDAAVEQMVRDAGTFIANSYSSMHAGEFNGFALRQDTLKNHATRVGGTVIPNPADPGPVDEKRVPDWARYTVRQPIDDSRIGFWQIYSIKIPTWGKTRGGRVVVYVRAWAAPKANPTKAATKPGIYRLQFRPGWLTDYQMLFDGPVMVGPGATLSGPVHSNGYKSSFFNQYATLPRSIDIDPGASCTAGARLTSAAGIGSIGGNGGCDAYRKESNAGRINVLRARDAAALVRFVCALGPSIHPNLDVQCDPNPRKLQVVLSGQDVFVRDAATGGLVAQLNAAVTGDVPGTTQGAVFVASGDVEISGSLSSDARATIYAASSAGDASYGQQSPPSAFVEQRGNVGARPGDPTSTFGTVVEGDVILDEKNACPVYWHGGVLTMTGLLSVNRQWRVPISTPGGSPCNQQALIDGSIVGHFPPLLNQPLNNAKYQNRTYTYLSSLYDNPPPLYPTASDWELVNFAEANLDCFASGTLDVGKDECT